MEGFLELWRRRLAIHAVIIFLLFGVLIGVRFAIEHMGGPSDDVEVHRWRMAHLEGLTRSFVLFGLAGTYAYFRLSRSLVALTASLIIAATWAAVIAAVLTALWAVTGRGGWTPIPPLPPDALLLHRIVFVIAAIASIGTVGALGLIVIRVAWEALREGIAPRTWHNWARIVAMRPRFVPEPDSLGELEELVQKAIDERIPVRALGAAATWNAMAASHGMMIRMEKLDRVLELDTASKTVKVQAGIQLRALCDHLYGEGFSLETTPVVPWIQVGGALALGCHGTGIHHDQFTELVTELEILHDVDGAAQLDVYTAGGTLPDDWKALLVNLGAMGVIYSVTLKIVPRFNVRLRDVTREMRSTIESELLVLLGSTIDDGTPRQDLYTEILWIPYNEDCIVKHWYPVSGDLLDPDPWRHVRDLAQLVKTKVLAPSLFWLLSLFPYTTPFFMRFLHDLAPREDRVMPAQDAMQYIARYPRVVSMGYALPFEMKADGFETVKKAWFSVVDRLDALRHEGIYPLNMVLHARFVKGGQAWLNPSLDEGHSCHIEILTAVNTPRHEEFFAAVEREWIQLGGRPHWAKLTFWPEKIRSTYPSVNFEKWWKTRDEMDPQCIFLNDHLRSVLGKR